MKAQNKVTKEVFEIFAMRPGKLILLVEGRQVEVEDENYALIF